LVPGEHRRHARVRLDAGGAGAAALSELLPGRIVLRNVAATALSFAGNCYYDLATGSLGPYAELMDYLHAVDPRSELLALRMQEVILATHSASAANAVEGIAAKPSLHVALPFPFTFRS